MCVCVCVCVCVLEIKRITESDIKRAYFFKFVLQNGTLIYQLRLLIKTLHEENMESKAKFFFGIV